MRTKWKKKNKRNTSTANNRPYIKETVWLVQNNWLFQINIFRLPFVSDLYWELSVSVIGSASVYFFSLYFSFVHQLLCNAMRAKCLPVLFIQWISCRYRRYFVAFYSHTNSNGTSNVLPNGERIRRIKIVAQCL